jgi:hypothetical protein
MTERIVPRPYPDEEPVQPRPAQENEEESRESESDPFDDDDDIGEDAVRSREAAQVVSGTCEVNQRGV